MGFWGGFFGHVAANVYRDMKREEKETQKWNSLFHEKMELESTFDKYLQSVGISDSYVGDVEYINNGSILPIKREIESIRKKVNTYLSLGGQGKNLNRLDNLDEEIETLEYLKKMGCVYRHEEFAGLGLALTQSILEREVQEREERKREIEERAKQEIERNALKEQGKKLLLGLKSNDLRTVLLEKYEQKSIEDIRIEWVQILNEDIAKQWIESDIDYDLNPLAVNIILTNDMITIYDYVTNSQVYYRHVWKENENILVEYTPFSDDAVSIIRFGELILCSSTDNAKKLSDFFNDRIKANLFDIEDINSLSGVEFEEVCQRLVEKMGFSVETTKASGDGGIDLIAYNHQPLLSGKYIIQCKRYSGSVGEPIIRDLYGVITSERANKGILMTTGYFTKSAIAFANGKQIELIDGKQIHELLCSYQLNESVFEEKIIGLTPQEVFANNIMIEEKKN